MYMQAKRLEFLFLTLVLQYESTSLDLTYEITGDPLSGDPGFAELIEKSVFPLMVITVFELHLVLP